MAVAHIPAGADQSDPNRFLSHEKSPLWTSSSGWIVANGNHRKRSIIARLAVMGLSWATTTFRRPRRSLSIVERPPLRAWRPSHSLWTGLDLVEVGAALWTDIFRDGPWLSLEITLGIRAYQHHVGSMRRHTISSSASASRRGIRPVLSWVEPMLY